MNLAPEGLPGKNNIPFLSLGSDVGVRTICFEGKSNLSGSFVVEEIERDGSEFRRLIFLNNPYVVQSEARLKQGIQFYFLLFHQNHLTTQCFDL